MKDYKYIPLINIMKLTCKDNCKYYIKNKPFNNCMKNIVGMIRENDGPCYKIQFSLKEEI